MPTPPKERRLTLKQQRFIEEYSRNGGNGSKAALAVYGAKSEPTARAIASENLAKPYIRREIDRLMKKIDLRTQDALQVVKDGLDAGGDQEPNWNARLRAADMTLKLKGAYPNVKESKHLHVHQTNQFFAEVPPEVLLWAARMIKELGGKPSLDQFLAAFGRQPEGDEAKLLAAASARS